MSTARKPKAPKPSEAVRILLALIAANREILQKEQFEGYVFENAQEARLYKQAYRQGASDVLRKLEEQLGGGK